MKRSPKARKLDEILRSSPIALGGFLGTDKRLVEEIIDDDSASVAKLGYTCEQIAARMKELTKLARSGLGTFVDAGNNLEVKTDDNRGQVICPWPHPARSFKTVTTVHNTKTGKTIQWSDLSIHMILAHCFFEGKGSTFRLEPVALIEMIF
jgi:hypothetical protein